MKLRSGFVSNSSSSSFVVRADEACPSVFALARKMIKLRGYGKEDKRDRKAVQALEAGGTPVNTPLAFNTTNYETFIAPVIIDNQLYFAVSTCHNHEWDELEVAFTTDDKVSRAISEEMGSDDDDLEWNVPRVTDFTWLRTGVRGRQPTPYVGSCRQCYSPTFQTPGGKILCVNCQAEVQPRSN
jgi:hypothetical protein